MLLDLADEHGRQQCGQDSIEKKKAHKMGGCINQAGTGEQDQAALDHVQNARLLLPAEVASDNAARERENRRPVNAKSLKPTECLGLNMMRSRAVAGGSR